MNQQTNTRHIFLFYLMAFGLAWIFWWPMALDHLHIISLPVPLIVGQSLGAFAPLLSVYLIGRIRKDRTIFTAPFESIKNIRRQIGLGLLAAVFALVIGCLVSFVVWGLDPGQTLQIIKPKVMNQTGMFVGLIILVQFITSLVGSPLGEEIGWRGFALTQLNKKVGRLGASVLVGALWWTWHIPLWIVIGIPLTMGSFLELVGFSFIIDTLFLYSGNNLLIAMLAHQSCNTKYAFMAGRTSVMPGVAIVWVIAILFLLILKRPRPGAEREAS